MHLTWLPIAKRKLVCGSNKGATSEMTYIVSGEALNSTRSLTSAGVRDITPGKKIEMYMQNPAM